MSKIPLEQRFSVLCQITRAQHFAWRQAVRELFPDADPTEVVRRMWELTGRETAKAYLKRIDPSKPLALQVAQGIAWSSHCMGEEASTGPGPAGAVEPTAGSQPDEAHVRHTACPWFDWHKRLDLLEEDRPGCDAWFQTTIDAINEALGTDLRFETVEALPEGGSCCLRRLWVEG